MEKTHNLIKSNFSTEEIMKQLEVTEKDFDFYYKKARQKILIIVSKKIK
ncbi:conserved domain protein [Streptococcus oralis SK255]|uniref:Conserved domain protein n=1 Tax=Streptococcus oralis SK255 TaxID=1005704 RepID=F5VWK4_STROR|nr:conserved domain protein [Streptococcus oralis SK255]